MCHSENGMRNGQLWGGSRVWWVAPGGGVGPEWTTRQDTARDYVGPPVSYWAAAQRSCRLGGRKLGMFGGCSSMRISPKLTGVAYKQYKVDDVHFCVKLSAYMCGIECLNSNLIILNMNFRCFSDFVIWLLSIIMISNTDFNVLKGTIHILDILNIVS